MSVDVITITVSGPTQSGKSAVLETIRQCLADDHDLAVVFADKANRLNPPEGIDLAAEHERPNPGASVIVLSETNELRSAQK